jgi:hypothetical protein
MWKLNISIVLIAIVAISISRRMRLSGRYDRNDKKAIELSPWKSLDRGIDPSTKDEKK